MIVRWTLIKSCTENELQKFCWLDLFLNYFSSVALSLFFQANHTKQQKTSQHAHHDEDDVKRNHQPCHVSQGENR